MLAAVAVAAVEGEAEVPRPALTPLQSRRPQAPLRKQERFL